MLSDSEICITNYRLRNGWFWFREEVVGLETLASTPSVLMRNNLSTIQALLI